MYAPGIHACSGNAGIFTRKANANSRKIHSWLPSDRGRCTSVDSSNEVLAPSGVARIPVAAAAASISRLPTRV